MDYEKMFKKPDYATRQGLLQIPAVFKYVYGWMFAGLALSGVVAWYTAHSGLWQKILAGPGFIACIVAELVLVFALSAAINKIPVALAYLMFIGYSALNGLTGRSCQSRELSGTDPQHRRCRDHRCGNHRGAFPGL